MVDLPSPPVPADADLRHFPNMPLEVGRLRDSDIASVADPEVFRCAVILWCAAYHQVPAGSLPDDDGTLARMAGLGRDLRTWKRLRTGVLRGFRRFADGRLYHRVVCEKVIEGLNSTLLHEWVKACARVRKENHHRSKQHPKPPKLPSPERPQPLLLAWPHDTVRAPEHEPGRIVRVPEREYDSERKGRDNLPSRSHTATPLGTVLGTSSLAATRGGHDGPTRDAVHALIDDAAKAVRVQ